jgi:hypothetical protein
MTEKKSLLSLVERLNIFLRYLELGGNDCIFGEVRPVSARCWSWVLAQPGKNGVVVLAQGSKTRRQDAMTVCGKAYHDFLQNRVRS